MPESRDIKYWLKRGHGGNKLLYLVGLNETLIRIDL